MGIVLISQNRLYRPERAEALDSTDTRLIDFVSSAGMLPVPIPNNPDVVRRSMRELNPVGLVLSGGNSIGSEPERDDSEFVMLRIAAGKRIPVFGICRGLQLINVFLGGTIKKVAGHVAVDHSADTSLVPTPKFMVNSFHEYGVDELGEDLEVAARAKDGVIEGAIHKRLPWLGVMWHPERREPFLGEEIALFRELMEYSRLPALRSRF